MSILPITSGEPYCFLCYDYDCHHLMERRSNQFKSGQSLWNGATQSLYDQLQQQQVAVRQQQQTRAFIFPPDIKKPNKLLLLLR